MDQRRANSNPDLDLNPDLASFPNPVDLDLKIFGGVDLDLSFSKVVDLDLNIAGFGFEDFKSTNPLYIYIEVNKNFSPRSNWTVYMYKSSLTPIPVREHGAQAGYD